MNTRDIVRRLLAFQSVPRLPIIEWATWWGESTARWLAEGMPPYENNVELMRYFGLDLLVQEWFCPRNAGCPRAAGHGASIIKDAGHYDELLAQGALYDERLLALPNFKRYARDIDSGNAAHWFTLEGFFWFPRTLLGIERHLLAFYDEAELVHRINRDLVAFYKRLLPWLFDQFQPDFMTFAEDMSYNHGSMISEQQFDEFMLPYYRELVDDIKQHGCKVLIDSDGNVSECLPWFERAGIEGVLPLERQAGVNVAAIRQQHPRLLMIGAFDKMLMHRGEKAMREEFERLMPVARQGGFIISVDHQTPPGVSLDDYRLYLKLFREYAQEL
jgi:hypothetical protein